MFTVTPIPAFTDNYIWAISIPTETGASAKLNDCKQQNSPMNHADLVAVVDPGDADAVESFLDKNKLSLAAILITHHHNDHTGGVKTLVNKHNVPVYGPKGSPFDGITHPLKSNEEIQLFGNTLTIQEIPGHTLDHISYFSQSSIPQLFCGDTLFLAGCGRLFEGTAKQMLDAMNYFKGLPQSTEVYCTHEYSLANLDFAAAVEPNNTAVQEAIMNCNQLRSKNCPTLPTSISTEQLINPFMRTTQADVINAASKFSAKQLDSEVEVFAAIREWKNQF